LEGLKILLCYSSLPSDLPPDQMNNDTSKPETPTSQWVQMYVLLFE